jgi:hypothetical protein
MMLAFVTLVPVFFIAPLIAAAIVGVFLLGMFGYRKALGISRGGAALVLLLCLVLSGAGMYYRDSQPAQFSNGPFGREPFWVFLAAGLLPFFAVPFLVKLYQRWIAGRLSDAEKAEGMEGIRAWLRGGNLICALFIAVFAYFGYGYSFWGVLALTVIALLAYPMRNMASTSFQPVPPKIEDLSPERERVLHMLDEGKITAEESAELLNALGHTVQPPRIPASTAADPHRKMVLTGLVLLLIGFFLPWFSFNLGDEMNRVLSGFQEQVNEISRQNPGVSINMPNTGSFHITGGEIRYGLGWFVLLLGIAAAALPYVANHLAPDSQHKARLIILGVGSLILIYLLTENVRFVSVGLLLGLAGYALQWVGTLKERQITSK